MNKFRNIIAKKYEQMGAIFLACLLHLLLFWLIWSYPEKQIQPNATVLEVTIINSGKEFSSEIRAVKKSSQHHKTETQELSENTHLHQGEKISDSKIKPVGLLSNPLPQIPDELRDEAFVSQATARFYIAPDGSVERVELTKPCANPKLNQLLLKSLRLWKFSPQQSSSTQDICVHFLVK